MQRTTHFAAPGGIDPAARGAPRQDRPPNPERDEPSYVQSVLFGRRRLRAGIDAAAAGAHPARERERN
jgi:hypothetical protein